jgi:hypothetical protein
MPDLIVRLKKKNDGSAALSCTRADGSVTWQRQEGQQGRFFPLHDLTHLAVESVLGFRRAFYGLLAEGWDITRFAAPRMSEQIPHEAFIAELIVGLLDVERASGEQASADDFNWKLETHPEARRDAQPAFRITEEQLAAIRQRRGEFFARWSALPVGGTLELPFNRAPDTNAAART